MTWNYRVFRRSDPGPEGHDPEVEYVIHEAYYTSPHGEETPDGWTARSVKPSGESLDALRWTLQRMLEACDKPVLEENEVEAVLASRDDG